MNIKDIANLAGVSQSTVSKIINNKDKSISLETRNRVLKIADEYQYRPYEKSLKKTEKKTRLIGVIVPSLLNGFYNNIINFLEKELIKNGYCLIISVTDDEKALEEKSALLLLAKKVECIVLFGNISNNEIVIENIKKEKTPILLSRNFEKTEFFTLNFDYSKSMTNIINLIKEKGFFKIPIIVDNANKFLIDFYKNEMKKSENIIDESLIFICKSHNDIDASMDIIIKNKLKIVICSNMIITRKLYSYANKNHLKIPYDLSIVCFDHDETSNQLIPAVTCVKFPFKKFAKECSEIILGVINQVETPKKNTLISTELNIGESLFENNIDNKVKIVVVGSLNMDIIFNVDQLLKNDNINSINQISMLPGGKGGNQAVAAAKLGADVSVIGCVGNDDNGKKLYTNLVDNSIDTKGLFFDNNNPTGSAYIFVTKDDEYSMFVHSGATNNIDCNKINKFRSQIEGAKFCLVQMDIALTALLLIKEICKIHNVNLILKPSKTEEISDELLKDLFMLIPNQAEIEKVVKLEGTYEDKVHYLYEKGVQNIILTLGKDGCYLKNRNDSKYFDAYKCDSVDTMGASDVFISTLSVFMAEDYDLDTAIKYANIAAGINTTKIGVQSSLLDKRTLEFHYKNLYTITES